MTDLPPGWVRVNVADVAEIQGGIQKQPKRKPFKNIYPFLRVANVFRGRLDLSDVHEIELFEGETDRYLLQTGDLLVVEGNGSPDQIGRAALWKGEISDCTHQNHLIRIRPTSALLPEYLAYAWNSPEIATQLKSVASSTSGLHTLSTAKLKAVEIPLPPLNEQKRIVATLEGYLSRLDAGHQLLNSTRKKIDALKRSVMEESFKGMPTLPLGTLLREPLRNGHSARASTNAQGIRTLTLTSVTKNTFHNENTKITAADPARIRDLWLKPGDILIQRSNTPDLVGTSALYSGPTDWAIFPDLLVRIRVSDKILSEFLTLALSSPTLRRYFKSRAKGLAGSMPKIDQPTILGAPIPCPSIEIQERIIEHARQSLDGAIRLDIQTQKLAHAAEALRKSLLAGAFAGRLLPQDPNDEPASVLLKRIKAERAAQVKAPRQRRTRKKVEAEGALW